MMASGKPVVRQIAWISLLPQLLLLMVLVWFWGSMGALIYLLASFILRRLIPRNHRKGIRCFSSGDYPLAIREFEKSYEFFTRHSWIDRYRYVVVLTSSRASYREMALLNIAYCYGQMGQGEKAKGYYRKTLEEFPESEMAKSALRMLNSVRGEGQGPGGL